MNSEEYNVEAKKHFIKYCMGSPKVISSEEQDKKASELINTGYEKGISPEKLAMLVAIELGIIKRC